MDNLLEFFKNDKKLILECCNTATENFHEIKKGNIQEKCNIFCKNIYGLDGDSIAKDYCKREKIETLSSCDVILITNENKIIFIEFKDYIKYIKNEKDEEPIITQEDVCKKYTNQIKILNLEEEQIEDFIVVLNTTIQKLVNEGEYADSLIEIELIINQLPEKINQNNRKQNNKKIHYKICDCSNNTDLSFEQYLSNLSNSLQQ